MRIQVLLSTALLAGAVTAQAGQPAPEIAFESVKNSAGEAFGDFKGRLVLLEQFAYW